ncbi:MBL fold metallo-hydrolase [Nocardioides sp. zg-579]|uniref:MBL fold metallo-hydrolase n=1 Tax=Nocardioides marmotae TaxID=2663857 RepID=A0A6I3IYB9_9ACTN|nr:MBL fold metallo-hydrolase [Nocardioides marmotae]MCR6030030.1 MBL fold metallo-hydrolase [Gordonia jinghuaiqii]MTB93661.1 MBL fold metallo-hydrolase [Nocardioides marmotae]QKE00011.1 MBL fold metallo-hydrolase [Nocardioides marmotae]
MRITKLGHACVRIEHEGTTIVLDPGAFTDPDAVDGADAVLVTHEHADHYVAETLLRADAPVYTIEGVAAHVRADAPDLAERLHVVAPGEDFTIGPIAVRAVGELHAVIHPELPRITNSGYLLDLGGHKVFHPGDALTGPGEPIDLLLLPVSAPWLKAAEAIDFAREVGAPRNLAIHDRIYSETGLGVIGGHLDRFLEPTGQVYTRLADGQDLQDL